MNESSTHSLSSTRQAAKSETPATYNRRRALAVLAAGVAIFGGFEAVQATHSVSEHNKLVTELKQSGSHADEEYFKGHFADKPVIGVKLGEASTAFAAASRMAAKSGGNVLDLQDIIVAEVGERPEADDVVVVNKDLVDPKTPGQILPVPNDSNVHVR